MTTTGATWDNLKLSFAGATEMPQNIIAHELLGNIFLPTNCTNGHEGYTLRIMATGAVARIITNAMRGPPALTHFFTPKNYTYPSLAGVTG